MVIAVTLSLPRRFSKDMLCGVHGHAYLNIAIITLQTIVMANASI